MKATNPKDLIGSGKLPLHLFPTTARAYGVLGLLDGMLKYGRSNWRAVGIRASIYYDAVGRHLDAWLEGEDNASDSGLPHLAHAIAGIAIIIDATVKGNMTDDRLYPTNYRQMMDELTSHVDRLKKLYAEKDPYHYTIEQLGEGDRDLNYVAETNYPAWSSESEMLCRDALGKKIAEKFNKRVDEGPTQATEYAVADLRKTLCSAQDMIAKLKAENYQLQLNGAEVRKKYLVELHEALDESKATVAQLETDREALLVSAEIRKRDIETAQKALQNARARERELTRLVDTQSGKIYTLEKTQERMREDEKIKEIENLRRKNRQLLDMVNAQAADIQELRGELYDE